MNNVKVLVVLKCYKGNIKFKCLFIFKYINLYEFVILRFWLEIFIVFVLF